MAKRYTVIKGSASTIAHLNSIRQQVSSKLDRVINSAGIEAQLVAQNAIRSGFDTSVTQQLTAEQACKEIGKKYEREEKRVTVYAPMNSQNRVAMHYLEYGAGVTSVGFKSDADQLENATQPMSQSGLPRAKGVWMYPLKNGAKDPHTELNNMGFALRIYRGYDKLYSPKKVYSKSANKWFGLTDRSKPLRYMAQARVYVMRNVPIQFRENIQLVLQRIKKR